LILGVNPFFAFSVCAIAVVENLMHKTSGFSGAAWGFVRRRTVRCNWLFLLIFLFG
jgi:hypothetical protein